MNIFFHRRTGYFIFTFFFIWIFSLVIADGLDPESGPEDKSSYSINDLYNRLETGAEGSQTTFSEPDTGPVSATSKSLNEIMAIAPSLDITNGAESEHVLAGKTFWGLTSGQWGLQTGEMPNAPVPKTGQTTSSDAGDDGDYQMGTAWPSPRFVDNDDGTVTDNLTGLMWTKNANLDPLGELGGPKTWYIALLYCNSLVYAGYSDWRLPNIRELLSLIDYSRNNPALPSGHPFEDVFSGYWSSTTFEVSDNRAWYVYMSYGYMDIFLKSDAKYVWPVRSAH